MIKDYMGSGNRTTILQQYDYMAALGPRMKHRLMDYYKIPASKLVNLGIARTDTLIRQDPTFSRQKIVDTLSLDSQKPIVLYAPTYWGHSSVVGAGLTLAANFPDNFSLVIRPHPQTPEKVLRQYREIVLSKKNVVIATEGRYRSLSLEELMSGASIIAGDVSSVMLEAILLNKPLIFMSLGAQHDGSYEPIRSIVDFSVKIESSDTNITTVLQRAILKGVDKQLWREAQRNNFFNFEGDSTKKIAAFISKLI
jgi:CDP-glycerol glycerophosphotransferase (TagB/SpsB family)